MRKVFYLVLTGVLIVGPLGCASMSKTEKGALIGATTGAVVGGVIGLAVTAIFLPLPKMIEGASGM